MISQMKALKDENRRLKRMVADLSMQADLLREALVKKVNRPSVDPRRMPAFAAGQRRGPLCGLPRNRLAGRRMAATAVARRGGCIALACPLPGRACMSERGAFGVGESCHRHRPRLSGENERIADLLIGLTGAKKTWGFGLCFLYRET
jgi:putative transposase